MAPGVFLVAALLLHSVKASTETAGATQEILRLVPRNVAACLVVEDFAGHYRRLADSPWFARAMQLPSAARWQQSEPYRRLVGIRALVPLFLGVQFEELRDAVFGQSVVLAYRPGPEPGVGDAGILFCHVADAGVLDRLFEALARPVDGRAVERRQHRGVEYLHRLEASGKAVYLLRLGAVGVLCEDESAIRGIIEADRDGGLASEPAIRQALAAIPDGSLIRLLIQPRRLDEHLRRGLQPRNPVEQQLTDLILDNWLSLRWLALSVHVKQDLRFGLHWSQEDSERVASTGSSATSGIWRLVPADAWLVVAGRWDFVPLVDWLSKFAAAEPNRELRLVASIFSQLLAGYDAERDLVPRLGPDVGLVVSPAADGVIQGVLAVQFEDHVPASGALPLSVALESALHPLLVIVGIEHNKNHKDSWETRVRLTDGVRIHYLSGARQALVGFEPGFAIAAGYLVFGTAPAAIHAWCRNAAAPPAKPAKLALDDLPPQFVPWAYVNVAAVVRYAQQHENAILDHLARTGDRTRAAERLQDLLALASLVDRLLLGSHRGPENSRHLTLRIQ